MMNACPVDVCPVLVVAASDSSGGAGISRDIETLASFGLHGALALTATTVQTHQTVRYIAPVDPQTVADQMQAAFSANPVAAVKIGLLPTASTVAAVAAVLRCHPEVPVVLDPVLKASSGGSLGARDAAQAIVAELLPLVRLVTPNRDEIAVLSGRSVATEEATVLAQARQLLAAGAAGVLAKGGHGAGASSVDHLIRPAGPTIPFRAPRLAVEMRGTGCMLASAIAAGLARGKTLEECVAEAKRHVHDRLRAYAERREGSATGLPSAGLEI